MVERPVVEISIGVSWFTVDAVDKRFVRLFCDHDLEERELMIVIFRFHCEFNGRMDVVKII